MDRRGAIPPIVVVLVLVSIVSIYFGYLAYQAIMVPPEKVATEIFDTVAITVTDANTRDAVENASVKISNVYVATDLTDADGRASFATVPSGTYTVLIKGQAADNYYWLSRPLSITGYAKLFAVPPYAIQRYGTYQVLFADNEIDVAVDTDYTQNFGLLFSNVRENSVCRGSEVTITIAYENLVFGSIRTTTGETLTEVTEGIKYTMSLGDMSASPKYVEFRMTFSGTSGLGGKVTLKFAIDDTPAVTDDVGAAKVKDLVQLITVA